MNIKLKRQVDISEKLQNIYWNKSGANGYGHINSWYAQRWLTLERIKRLALRRLGKWYKLETSAKRCGYTGPVEYLGSGKARIGSFEKSLSSLSHRLESANSLDGFLSLLK